MIVVDKFHVVQYAQKALNAIRVKIKKDLPKEERKVLTRDRWILLRNAKDLELKDIVKRNEWFNQSPNLKTAYWLKEGIRNIYKASDRQEALERYEKWENDSPKDFKEFKEIRKTFNNHNNR